MDRKGLAARAQLTWLTWHGCVATAEVVQAFAFLGSCSVSLSVLWRTGRPPDFLGRKGLLLPEPVGQGLDRPKSTAGQCRRCQNMGLWKKTTLS